MIKVTIELVSAITHKTSEIGRMFICNDGEGTGDRGNYNVYANRRGSEELPYEAYVDVGVEPPVESVSATRLGKVLDYPRQAYNVWRLIGRSVLAAFPEERNNAKGKHPVLDAKVVKGLEIMRKAAHTCAEWIDDRQAVTAAEEWLDAGGPEQ